MLTAQVNYTTALHARAVRVSPDTLDRTGDIETHHRRTDAKDLLAF